MMCGVWPMDRKKKLQIFFHRNSSKDDTEMDVQAMTTYGYGKVPLENMGGKRKEKNWLDGQ